MNESDTPIPKVGRPSTRMSTKGRSNSLGSHPRSPNKTIIITSPLAETRVITPVPNMHVDRPQSIRNVDPVVTPVVNVGIDEPEPPRDEEAAIPPVVNAPRDQPQQPRDAEPGIPIPNPTGENNYAHTEPPNGASASQTHDIPRVDPREQARKRMRKQAQIIVEECQEFLEIYEGIQLNPHLLSRMEYESKELLTSLSNCYDQLDDDADLVDVVREIRKWKRIIKTFVVSMLGKYKDPTITPASPPPATSPSMQSTHAPRDKRDASPNTVDLLRRDLIFFMSKLHDNNMPDIGLGAEVSNSELRDLHDIRLPRISKAIDDCRKVLKSYSACASYDRNLAREAQETCEEASIWSTDLVDRFYKQKLHLDKNVRQREITFSIFKPGGEVSIYQFMNKFEAWADGYLSEEAKADQLFNKYLDKSITECYTEISTLQENFEAMKRWLIKKYGSIVPIAHGCIKAIAKLKVPSEANHTASVQYLRSIHKLLVNLPELEIAKGKPVPQLQNYLGSNAFLSALLEAIPPYIQDDTFKVLMDKGIDDVDTIEGKQHLPIIVDIIKRRFTLLELKIKSTPTQTTQINPQSSNKTNKSTPATQYKSTNVTNTPQPNVSLPSPQQNPAPINTQPPRLTGGNTVPINNPRPQSHQQNQPTWNRWSCPVKDHHGHNVSDCIEFWNMPPRQKICLQV